MKIITNSLKMAFVLFVSFVLNQCYNGCSKQSPITAEENDNSQLEQDNNLTSNLTFIKWNNSYHDPVLGKVLKTKQFISYQNGGELKLNYKTIQTDYGEVKVFIMLKVFPQTISHDATLSLSLDDEFLIGNIAMEYGPHGITFSKPAMLEIFAQGVDLSGFNPEKIDIYYDNQVTGELELIKSKKIIIKEDIGTIRVVYAEIPHFSRYALAHSQ